MKTKEPHTNNEFFIALVPRGLLDRSCVSLALLRMGVALAFLLVACR